MTTWKRAADWRNWTLSEVGSRDSQLHFGLSHDLETKTGLTAASGTAGQSVVVGADALSIAPSGTGARNTFSVDLFNGSTDGVWRLRLKSVFNTTNSLADRIVPDFSFRFTDDNNRYVVLLNTATPAIELYKVVAGSATLLSSASFAYTSPIDVTLEVTLSGSSISVKDLTNNVTVSATDSSIASGKIAFGGNKTGEGGTNFEWLYKVSTSLAGTATSPAVDGGGANWNALLQWEEDLAGGGDVTFDVQDSSDGVTFADVAGLTGVTDPSGTVMMVPRRYGRLVAHLTRSSTADDPILKTVAFGSSSASGGASGGDADTTPPSPAPTGAVASTAETSFAVTVLSVSGEASTTLRLQTRPAGSADPWTTQAEDDTPAEGDSLEATGLTTGANLEWRLVELDAAGNVADGTHGTVRPAAPPVAPSTVVDPSLEYYVALSIIKTLTDAFPDTLIQQQGFYDPADPDVKEWLAVDLIAIKRKRSRARTFMGTILFNVVCVSRVASQRDDGKTNAPWLLAAQVRAPFEHVSVPVKKYGESSELEVGRLKVDEAEMSYASEGDETSPTGIHYVTVSFQGKLTEG